MAHHFHILGASGTGKSTHAKHLFNSALHRGDGLLFLTPHAEDADDLIETIPKKRRNHTLLFDPTEFPLKWNPFDQPPHRRELVADATMGAIRSVAKLADVAAANMDMTVHSCALALMEYGGTMLDVTTMLLRKGFRQTVTQCLTNDAGKEHWEWFEERDERQKGEITRSTYNKFYQLKSTSAIRQVFGHKETKLNVFDVVHENKVLIARLPNGKLGESKTKLVGNLLLAMVHVAAMSRTTTTPFYIFADECHWWAADILRELLTGARKFHVKLVCINQFANQLEPELFDALKGNAESHVFRVSEEDARRYQRWFPENSLSVNLEDLPDFTYRKFPWKKGDRDVTLAPFDAERFPRSRSDIELRMRLEMM